MTLFGRMLGAVHYRVSTHRKTLTPHSCLHSTPPLSVRTHNFRKILIFLHQKDYLTLTSVSVSDDLLLHKMSAMGIGQPSFPLDCGRF